MAGRTDKGSDKRSIRYDNEIHKKEKGEEYISVDEKGWCLALRVVRDTDAVKNPKEFNGFELGCDCLAVLGEQETFGFAEKITCYEANAHGKRETHERLTKSAGAAQPKCPCRPRERERERIG
jgi:hypothetical protein